jgi:hypothetical protein
VKGPSAGAVEGGRKSGVRVVRMCSLPAGCGVNHHRTHASLSRE